MIFVDKCPNFTSTYLGASSGSVTGAQYSVAAVCGTMH